MPKGKGKSSSSMSTAKEKNSRYLSIFKPFPMWGGLVAAVLLLTANTFLSTTRFAILYNVGWLLFLVWLAIMFLVTVWRKEGIHVVFYNMHWWLLGLVVVLLINVKSSFVLGKIGGFVDVFVYLPYHPWYLPITLMLAWAFAVIVHTHKETLQRVAYGMVWTVLLIDVLAFLFHKILLLVDIPSLGGKVLTDLISQLGQIWGSKNMYFYAIWGDLGTYLFAHALVFVTLLYKFNVAGLLKPITRLKESMRLLGAIAGLALFWYGAWLVPAGVIFGGVALLLLVFALYLSKQHKVYKILGSVALFGAVSVGMYMLAYDNSGAAYRVLPYLRSVLGGTASLLTRWFEGFAAVNSVWAGGLGSPLTRYLLGVGPYHSNLIVPVLFFNGTPVDSYLPVVNYVLELGLVYLGLLLVLGIKAAMLMWRYKSEVKVVSLMTALGLLYSFFFYPSILGWFVLWILVLAFFEQFAAHYKGVMRLGIYFTDIKGKYHNYTRYAFLVLALLVGSVGMWKVKYLNKSIWAALDVQTAQLDVVNATDSDTQAKVEKLNILLARTSKLSSVCNNCVLADVAAIDSEILTLRKLIDLSQEEQKDLQLQNLVFDLGGRLYATERRIFSPNVMRLVGAGYELLYNVSGSELYRDRALTYMGRYLVFAPTDTQASLTFARLIVDAVNKDNYMTFEPRLAAVLKILEEQALQEFRAYRNIGLLWQVTNLKASYLLKVERYEEVKKLYQQFKQFIGNINMPADQKEQLTNTLDQILQRLDELTTSKAESGEQIDGTSNVENQEYQQMTQ